MFYSKMHRLMHLNQFKGPKARMQKQRNNKEKATCHKSSDLWFILKTYLQVVYPIQKKISRQKKEKQTIQSQQLVVICDKFVDVTINNPDPADKDVSKTSSGRRNQVMTSYDQTRRRDISGRRRRIYYVSKMSVK